MLRALIDAGYRGAYRLAYQGMKLYWRVLKPQTRGTAVAVWHEGRLLFVRNSYRRGLSLPGGGVSRGENPREAARRELAEEVGIHCELEELEEMFCLDWQVDAKRDQLTLFELRREHACEIQIDNREIVAAIWLGIEEARRQPIGRVARRYLQQFDGFPG